MLMQVSLLWERMLGNLGSIRLNSLHGIQLVLVHKQINYDFVKSEENKIWFWNHLWESTIGGKHADNVLTRGASARICAAIMGSHFLSSPQPFTCGSYWAIEHSPSTSASQTSATKSILKATLPAVPTLFHLSNAHKAVNRAVFYLWVRTHTSCQST